MLNARHGCCHFKNLLAAGFRDGVVTLWDMNDWHEIVSFQAQPSCLFDLAFSPDGTLLVTCGEEHSFRCGWSNKFFRV